MEDIIINGNKYASYKEACDSLGLNYNTIAVARRRKGKSWEDMILEYAEKQPRQIVFRGVSYKSTVELCEAYGVNYGVLITNKNTLGLTVEEALDYALSKRVIIDGEAYDSYAQACKTLGININSVVKFRQKHKEYSMVDAIIRFKNLPRTESGKLTAWGFTYQGTEYSSLADACRKLGYNLNEARAIKNKTHADNSKVLDILADRVGTRIEGSYNGVPFSSLTELCKERGVPVSSVIIAMRESDLSVEDALSRVEERNHTPVNSSVIMYNGELYSSPEELSKAVGVDAEMLKTYASYGYSYTDAIHTLLREKNILNN